MINSALKRLILPFSSEKNREPFSYEAELASVFAVAEFERSKGKGLVVRQPNEKIRFIIQAAYPLWIYPKNETTYLFDALDRTNGSVLQLPGLPSSKEFLENLQSQSKTIQDYVTYLLDHQGYFKQPQKEKQVLLKGLIADMQLKTEFALYRREASESGQSDITFFTPRLTGSEVSATLSELAAVQTDFREDSDALSECIRQISKLTGQYVTELDYAGQAVKDEAAAKIKAQEELINPQVAKINSDYKKRVTAVSRSYDEEIASLEKQKIKNKKAIESYEEKIKHYQREAQSQARQNHLAYEKRWKIKGDKAKKEVDGFKKQLVKLEKNISNLSKQKNDELNWLGAKKDAEINVCRQPLLDLQAVRDAKMLVFKQQIGHLQQLEKTVAETIYSAIREREAAKGRFESLGIKDSQLKNPLLFYIPFYVVCYQADLSRRYLFVPPSERAQIGFSSWVKGAFGLSKAKEMFVPRFKATSALVEKCQVLVRQDTAFEFEMESIGEKNNLLEKSGVSDAIAKGLVYLQHEGKLSDKEYQALSDSLKTQA